MIGGLRTYTALLRALLPVVVARLFWRALRQPEYLRNIPERFGHYTGTPPGRPLLWIHAVSVGETRAAEPVVRAVRKRVPGMNVLLTHMTPTGRETGEELFGDDVARCYLPYDFPGAVKRFLAHYRPTTGMLMETEIWPNLVRACRDGGIPVHLVNARLSEKSASGYRRLGGIAGGALKDLSTVFAQTAADAQRFSELGAERIVVTGNLKFDIDPAPAQLAAGDRWRAEWGKRPVFLAASTRDGEEALLLGVIPALPPDVLVVIVPRHPQRFTEVASMLAQGGVPYQRRSANAPLQAGTRVLLGDSMGEMFAYYRACDVAFIGGTLLPFGGQNLIEACAVGRPVLMGPHTYNFSEAAEQALEAGAARRVGSAAELAAAAAVLLENRNAAAAMGDAAARFSRAHRGATERLLDVLKL